MTNNDLIYYVANGLIETGIEGGTDNVCCSTADEKDSICIGVSSWEDERAEAILRKIHGLEEFAGVPYSELTEENLDTIAAGLDSDEGVAVQRDTLAADSAWYIDEIKSAGVENPRCIIYCGMWCPTSVHVVIACIGYAERDGIDINDVDELAAYFFDNYAYYAACEEYEEGYQNRSDITLDYVKNLEI